MNTPSELGISKGTVIPPKGGGRARTWYIVNVSYSATNTIHKSLFFTGFLTDGKPSGYNILVNETYESNKKISDAYYIEAVIDLRSWNG